MPQIIELKEKERNTHDRILKRCLN